MSELSSTGKYPLEWCLRVVLDLTPAELNGDTGAQESLENRNHHWHRGERLFL